MAFLRHMLKFQKIDIFPTSIYVTIFVDHSIRWKNTDEKSVIFRRGSSEKEYRVSCNFLTLYTWMEIPK